MQSVGKLLYSDFHSKDYSFLLNGQYPPLALSVPSFETIAMAPDLCFSTCV